MQRGRRRSEKTVAVGEGRRIDGKVITFYSPSYSVVELQRPSQHVFGLKKYLMASSKKRNRGKSKQVKNAEKSIIEIIIFLISATRNDTDILSIVSSIFYFHQ